MDLEQPDEPEAAAVSAAGGSARAACGGAAAQAGAGPAGGIRQQLVQLVQLALQACVQEGVLPEAPYPQPVVQPLSASQRKLLLQQRHGKQAAAAAAAGEPAASPAGAAAMEAPAPAAAVPAYSCAAALAVAAAARRTGRASCSPVLVAEALSSRLDRQQLEELQVQAAALKGHLNFTLAADALAQELQQQHHHHHQQGSRRQDSRQTRTQLAAAAAAAAGSTGSSPGAAAGGEQPTSSGHPAAAAAAAPRRLEIRMVANEALLADKQLLQQEFELYKSYQVGMQPHCRAHRSRRGGALLRRRLQCCRG
jgi:hypothetical protein